MTMKKLSSYVFIALFGFLVFNFFIKNRAEGQRNKKVHKRVIKGLKKNEIFLLEAYTPKQMQLGTGGPKDLDMFMTEQIISDELSKLKPFVGASRN